MMYDYCQLAKILNADRLRIANIVHNHKIKREITDRKVLFSEEAVEEIKKYLNKRKVSGLWKVSVFDEKLEKFIVRAVCLTYDEAREFCAQLVASGFLARYSRHNSKKYLYE